MEVDFCCIWIFNSMQTRNEIIRNTFFMKIFTKKVLKITLLLLFCASLYISLLIAW